MKGRPTATGGQSGGPRVLYDPALVEEVVRLEIDRRRRCGDAGLVEAYRRGADPLYGLIGTERERAFVDLHGRLFQEIGVDRGIRAVLARHASALAPMPSLTLLSAVRDEDEGADLGRPVAGTRPGVIRIRPSRCLAAPDLATFLDHALIQLRDLLDPGFAHDPRGLATLLPHRRRLAQERYRLAWAASVDARLSRSGRPALAHRAEHEARLGRCFPGVEAGNRARLFEAMWSAARPTHALLMAVATTGLHLAGNQPGGPCSLCGFPTHAWADPPDVGVREAIRRDVPAWEDREGLCERCLEAYQARVTG